MFRKIIFVFCFLLESSLFANHIQHIRSFDLGGYGLKTAILSYNKDSQEMIWTGNIVQLGQCPDDCEVHVWIRTRLQELESKDLDSEIAQDYLFAFSLAGLEKLRYNQPLHTSDVSKLFQIPQEKIHSIEDGSAHLIASLNSINLKVYKGPIWNFSLGTAVGLGFTDHEHHVRETYDLWKYFDIIPWDIVEPNTNLPFWIVCGSRFGFEKLVADNDGVVDEIVFNEFSLRWISFLNNCILNQSSKSWGLPVAIVFTGGHIDYYENRLVDLLNQYHLSVPVFNGPKNAGLLGAAWHAVKKHSVYFSLNEKDHLGKTRLIHAIEEGNLEKVKSLVVNGAEINNFDYSGQTPLYYAVRSKNLEIIAFLIDCGSELNVYDCWRQSPLYFAESGSEIEKLLLKHGAQLYFEKIE